MANETTTDSRDFDVQVFTDMVQGVFSKRDALIGASQLASSGAIMVDGQMPFGGPRWIGQTVLVPYFGSLGEFEDTNENVAATVKELKATNETGTVGRSSLAFEMTRWAQFSMQPGVDPYMEAARQLTVSAGRKMDQLCVDKAATTSLVHDVYGASAAAAQSLDWDVAADAHAMWGDEQEDIVGMAVHSRVEIGLRKLRDGEGKLLLVENMVNGSRVRTFMGRPLVVSDKLPLTGSSMGTVTESGASVGGVTISSGTPTGPWKLRVIITVGGARGTAKFKFSTDGGNTYSAEMTTAATVSLIDTATDSLVGHNGTTGLVLAFGVATYDVLSTYATNAILKAHSLIFQRGAMAFWYAAAHMAMKSDTDILKDNDVAAMHMYRLPHLYRRRVGGTKPGAVLIKHNVPGFLPA